MSEISGLASAYLGRHKPDQVEAQLAAAQELAGAARDLLDEVELYIKAPGVEMLCRQGRVVMALAAWEEAKNGK